MVKGVLFSTILVIYLHPCLLQAKVVAIEVNAREQVMGGQPFGLAGPYEKLAGQVHFEFDPLNPMNTRIVDLDKAPVNTSGRVEAWANFMVLKPTRGCIPPCIGLLEVSNRGHKAALAYLNEGDFRLNPQSREDFGDGLLMRQGLTVIWVGWQFDVPEHQGLLRLHVPIAHDAGQPIDGLVRSDWTVDEPLKHLPLGHRGHIPYPVADPKDPRNVLTMRSGRLAPRIAVPRTEWQFVWGQELQGAATYTHIYNPKGFSAGYIYELVYLARDPAIVGLGLAAVRDMMAYAKYDKGSLFHVDRGIAFGVSQAGRFLRHFLYQGFNTDESGRQVFDGMLIHAAGAGRGSFNHRFAQPSRDAHRYSSFFYPTDLFPFAGRLQQDPVTRMRDGLYAHAYNPTHLPKIIYTNTGYEYWGRAASLIHTSPDGLKDLELAPNERVYHLAGGQHFVGEFPPKAPLQSTGVRAYGGNPLDFRVNLRALLLRLIDWITWDRAPPASRYPRIKAGTLVPIHQLRFPALPGLPPPKVIHEAYRLDYGPRWPQGIIDHEPPRLGQPFPSLVAAVDEFGNELGGIRNVELRVPLATYTPWLLRQGYAGGNGELEDFLGSFIPFPRDEHEQRRTQDPRPALSQLYRSRQAYLGKVRQAALELEKEGFLLPQDLPRVMGRAARYWDWVYYSR